MAEFERVRSVTSGEFDVSRWESYFTTRDGALADIAAMRHSLSWRVTSPLRGITMAARTGLAAARGTTRPPRHPAGTAAFALDRRLHAVAPAILGRNEESGLESAPTAQLLELLCHRAARSPRRFSWLLYTAVSGSMPTEGELTTFVRTIAGDLDSVAMSDLIDLCGRTALEHSSQLRDLKLISDRPVLLVDFIARHGFNSGVQRVAREVATRWQKRGVELVAMSGGAFRTLDDDERARVLEWDSKLYSDVGDHRDEPTQTVLVPWETTLVIPEVPNREQSPTLAALARHSGNRVAVVVHDTIPTSSASFVRPGESVNFAAYLSMIKNTTVVIANSESTAEEFRGFCAALAAQGVTGPEVRTERLPVGALRRDADSAGTAHRTLPLVVSVGSHEPRKNHIALIFAAERLWREGHRFSLLLLGGRGPHEYTDVHDAVTALAHRKRPIEVRNDVSDEELAEAYAAARFSVFLSLHEGFGLPVAESIGAGTPVLVTQYGSVGEIAAGGGCVSVNPRDDEAIVQAMRELLTDDELIRRLRDEIAARPDPDWDDYADALWAHACERQDTQ